MQVSARTNVFILKRARFVLINCMQLSLPFHRSNALSIETSRSRGKSDCQRSTIYLCIG